MRKKDDVEDLLGENTKPAKKAATKKAATKKAAAPVAKKVAKKAAEPVGEKAPRVRKPVVFEEGEKEALMKRVPKFLKNPINSKDLATKLGVPTRRLRPVLYSMQRAGTVSLELSAARAQGMTVSAARAQGMTVSAA